MFYYPVDICITVFSYSHAVQYHTILHGCLLYGLGLCGILATTMCFNYRMGAFEWRVTQYFVCEKRYDTVVVMNNKYFAGPTVG